MLKFSQATLPCIQVHDFVSICEGRVGSTYWVATCLKDDNTVGKSLVVGFNAESSLFPVDCVFLDEKHIFYPCNLRRTKNQKEKEKKRERVTLGAFIYLTQSTNPRVPLAFFSSLGASTFSLQLRSMICIAPSSLLDSWRISLPRKTGISGHVGKRFSYAWEWKQSKFQLLDRSTLTLSKWINSLTVKATQNRGPSPLRKREPTQRSKLKPNSCEQSQDLLMSVIKLSMS